MTETAELKTTVALLDGLEAERHTLEALLPRIDDIMWQNACRADGWSPHDIIAHLADSNYGLALMTLGELQPSLPLSDKNWMQVDDYNQQRRIKNAALPREKVMSHWQAALTTPDAQLSQPRRLTRQDHMGQSTPRGTGSTGSWHIAGSTGSSSKSCWTHRTHKRQEGFEKTRPPQTPLFLSKRRYLPSKFMNQAWSSRLYLAHVRSAPVRY